MINAGILFGFAVFRLILQPFLKPIIAAYLLKYAPIIGFKNGCSIKRNTANPNNIPALINLLNYVGCTIDAFHKDLYQEGLHQYTMSLPLTLNGLINNRINLNKVNSFIKNGKENIDYKLLLYNDLEKIEQLYQNTNFKIVAILPEYWTGQKPQFLAVPFKV